MTQFGFLVTAINIMTLIFFTYMSVMISRPLSTYWKEFLVSYRTQSLGQARLVPTDDQQSRRLNEASVREADR